MKLQTPRSLMDFACEIVSEPDPARKVELAEEASQAWRLGRLDIGIRSKAPAMPNRPGRPDKPELLAPREMPKRSAQGSRGRFALVHSLAHIELNAIDLTWDLIGRFATTPMPNPFLDDWVRVGSEEAKHFALLTQRLGELGGQYGDLPAHDGLWQAAQDTGHSLIARMAIVPLVLEARGLDVSPSMIAKAREVEDHKTADILSVIYNDEKNHVAFGAKWFRYLCAQDNLAPEPEFHRLVRKFFRGHLKPPFNDKARSEAGVTPGFYKPLCGIYD